MEFAGFYFNGYPVYRECREVVLYWLGEEPVCDHEYAFLANGEEIELFPEEY